MPAKKVAQRKVLSIDQLKFDEMLQPRVEGLNDSHLDDLRRTIREAKVGSPIKPLPLIYMVQGTGPMVVRGWHTIEAYKLEGKDKVMCEVLEGSYDEAKLAAAASNFSEAHIRGPLKMSWGDKRKAVEMILDIYPKMSGVDVAKRLNGGVSTQLVYDIKRERGIAAGEREDDTAERQQRHAASRGAHARRKQRESSTGSGATEQVLTVDWKDGRDMLGDLAKFVNGIVKAHTSEKNCPHHEGCMRLLDELDAKLFGDDSQQNGWMQKLLPKKGK